MSSTSAWTRAKGTAPGRPTAMPSAIVVIVVQRHRVPGGERTGIGRGAARPARPTTRTSGRRALTATAMPGEQAAAAGADDDGAYVRALLQDLQADRPLAGHDVDVVEGMDQHRTGGLAPSQGLDQGLVHGGAVHAHIGAVGPGRGDLGDRRAVRHEHRRTGPEGAGGQGHALRVVPGARGDHAAGTLGWE